MDGAILSQLHHYAELMLDNVPIGMALFEARDMKLLASNAFFCSMRFPNFSQEQVDEQPIFDLVIPPALFSIKAIFHEVISTGTAYQSDEYAVSTLEGRTTYWTWSLAPIRNEEGEVTQVLLTTSQVTDQILARKRTEEAHRTELEQERQRLQTLLDQLPEGIIFVEAATECISYVNKASLQILGVTLEQLGRFRQNRELHTYQVLDSQGQAVPTVELPPFSALRGEIIAGREYLIRRHDGSE